jgi:hypothetical protein
MREESVKRAHQKLLAAQQQRQARKQQEERWGAWYLLTSYQIISAHVNHQFGEAVCIELGPAHLFGMFLVCRAAVDLQIKQQKAQRDQLEALKQQELQDERQELQCWQQQLPDASAQQQHQVKQGDESDYDDDTTDADAEVIGGHGKQQDSTKDGQTDDTYHGKGYWPSKAAADATPGSSKSSSSSTQPVADEGGQAQELTEVSSSKDHEDTISSLQCLVGSQPVASEAGAACKSMMLNTTITDSTAAEEPFLSASSTRRLMPAKAASTGTRDNSSKSFTKLSNSNSSSVPQKPVAPVRSRAAPVQVMFTQLETPHLPAREQREVEIKQIKQAAGHKVKPAQGHSEVECHSRAVCAHALCTQAKLALEQA